MTKSYQLQWYLNLLFTLVMFHFKMKPVTVVVLALAPWIILGAKAIGATVAVTGNFVKQNVTDVNMP
jgi:hypothetical protein